MHIVCKFGGSSVASKEGIENILRLATNPQRRFFTFSALGKSKAQEKKVTDLLIDFYPRMQRGDSLKKEFEILLNRFSVFPDIPFHFIERLIEKEWKKMPSSTFAFALSRGEYWTAKCMAILLDVPFIDSVDCIRVDRWDYSFTTRKLSLLPRAVIPAFYGRGRKGIALYPRGGGDITGSVIARGTNAGLYENWTDVEGVYTLSPTRKENPTPQPLLTFLELKILSYFGGKVFHPLAIYPLACPLSIGSTYRIDGKKTYVGQVERRGIAGVCEKNGRIFAIDDFHREEKICQRLKESLQKGGIPIEEEKIEKGYASVKVEKGCEEKALFCVYQTLIEEENNKRI